MADRRREYRKIRKQTDIDLQALNDGALRPMLELFRERVEEVQELGQDWAESADNLEEFFPNDERVETAREAADSLEEYASDLEDRLQAFEDALDELVAMIEFDTGAAE